MQITILGAGAWGTALAIAAARQPQAQCVTLWSRDEQQVQQMRHEGSNVRYLPGYALPAQLRIKGGEIASAVAGADLVVLATPTAALRPMLHALVQARVTVPVAWLCKGFEATSAQSVVPCASAAVGLMPHEVCASVAPGLVHAAFSGPSFAQEVAAGRPTCLVAASGSDVARRVLMRAFLSDSLRVYANDDIVGVEVGGAVKNVLAIAAGLCDGLELGLNARAALLTRGLAEMTRLGVALGAQPATFMGLSGMGDLILTATGDLSRNRRVGLLLARGHTLEQAVQSLGHVAEGVYSARTVVQRARACKVEMPIAETVVQLLDGRMPPADAVQQLMTRTPRHE